MAFLELNKESKPVNFILANGNEYVFKYGERTSVPTLVAIGFIGSNDYRITFSLEDKEAISSASDWTIELLKTEFGVKGNTTDLIDSMFPTTKSKKIVKTVKKVVKPAVTKKTIETTKESKSTEKVDKHIASSEK
jgi:hypothetical protein